MFAQTMNSISGYIAGGMFIAAGVYLIVWALRRARAQKKPV